MAYSALLEYIRKAKGCSAPDDEIIDRLVQAGWYRVDVQDALSLYEKLVRPVNPGLCEPIAPPPRASFVERIAPRHYDPRLIAIACLAFALGFLAFVVFMH